MSEFDRLSENFSQILLFLGLFIVFPAMCYVFYDITHLTPSGDFVFTFTWLLVSVVATSVLVAVASPFLLIMVYLLEFFVSMVYRFILFITSKSGL